MTNLRDARLDLAWPIDLRLTVASHGWAYLAPWAWDPEHGRLARIERIGERVGTIAVTQSERGALDATWDGFAATDAPEIVRRIGRWVSAEWDPAPAVAALGDMFPDDARLIARGGGRLLRCSNFYEDFLKTLLTVNTSWAGTVRMSAALVAQPGDGAFPAPAAMLDYGEERLRTVAKLGFRAPTAVAATRRLLDDGVLDAGGNGDPDRLGHDYLLGLKGIGPYAAAHCRMLLHDFSRIPVDSVAVAHLRERHATTPAEFLAARAHCGIYIGLGYRLMRLREKFAVPDLDLGLTSGIDEGGMSLTPFAEILDAARARHGAAALEARLPTPKTADELRATPDDRYLSDMQRRIFRAGLKHSVVDAKWPAFEDVFQGFEPRRVRAMPDEALEKLMGDARLIRHWGKLKSVRDNAAALLDIAAEHGSFGAWLAAWPGSDIVGLWEALAKRFSQMGGNSGPSFLRMVGKDTFVPTPAVIAALQEWGAVAAPPKNRQDRARVQAAFNAWAGDSGRPLCHLSLILAASVEA
jgi:3-methyladenine DNA glycosylase Tag/3-methyladenine DNA glycosylase/8-oxoguanine DNA glycosylase